MQQPQPDPVLDSVGLAGLQDNICVAVEEERKSSSSRACWVPHSVTSSADVVVKRSHFDWRFSVLCGMARLVVVAGLWQAFN